MSILYSFSAMSIMMSKIVAHTLILQRLLQTEFFFSSSNSFYEAPLFPAFRFGISFPFMFSQSNVPFFQPTLHCGLTCIPYFLATALAARPMLVVSISRTTDSLNGMLSIFLRPFFFFYSRSFIFVTSFFCNPISGRDKN